MSRNRSLKSFAIVLLLAALAAAQDVASFEKRTTVKKLANGLTVVICERPEAPVFSFFTHVDAGSVQDPLGQTGLAHMFEHMAFKGTDKIGTKDYAAEKVALEKVEQAYAAYIAERDKPVGRDEKKLKDLEKAWKDAVADADKYVKPNEFPQIVEINGGEDLNANTSDDETNYFYSFPENRLELWAYLESERFLHPVMREFYKERNVVIEERRMRTDSNPIGRLLEQFTTAAFQAHEYHRPTIGWMSDLNSFSATDAKKFFDEYYIPSNMVVTVVGDVKASETMPIIEKYFGRIPSRPRPDERTTTEPPQNAERRVVLQDMSQPLYLEGYHRPDYRSPDDAVYDAIADLMSSGRTSRLYRALVRDKKIAADSAGFSGLPGNKYPHLFAFYAFPLPGHKPDEMADAIHVEIEKLKNEDISDEELKMIKTRAKANLIRSLGSNEGLANSLALYQARYDDWRELFRSVDRIDKVSKADIRRVANQTFVPTNRTVGIIETKPAAPAADQKGGAQ
ncbi:MAG TPA: pitrilysin family protein [Terriglobales bacterium]|jgi:predicted Zn-dependent peptidase|nr:pitrilysin family protein [Terriglobales bacterium]